MAPKSTYYKVSDIPEDFIKEQLQRINKNWGSNPVRDLSDICCDVAKAWAKRVNDPYPHLARLEATSYEKVSWSVYSIYHNNTIEQMLTDMEFRSLKHDTTFYWFPKRVTYKSVNHWLGDDYRGTMENPY